MQSLKERPKPPLFLKTLWLRISLGNVKEVIYNGRRYLAKEFTKLVIWVVDGVKSIGKKIDKAVTDLISWVKKKTDNAKDGSKKKSVSLPSAKKIKLDKEHILSGHSADGTRGESNKDRFPNYMSEKAIFAAIMEAYKHAKILMTQGDRIFAEGRWGNYKI